VPQHPDEFLEDFANLMFPDAGGQVRVADPKKFETWVEAKHGEFRAREEGKQEGFQEALSASVGTPEPVPLPRPDQVAMAEMGATGNLNEAAVLERLLQPAPFASPGGGPLPSTREQATPPIPVALPPEGSPPSIRWGPQPSVETLPEPFALQEADNAERLALMIEGEARGISESDALSQRAADLGIPPSFTAPLQGEMPDQTNARIEAAITAVMAGPNPPLDLSLQPLKDIGRFLTTPLIEPETGRALGEAIPGVGRVTGPLFEAAAQITSPAEIAALIATAGAGPAVFAGTRGAPLLVRGAGTVIQPLVRGGFGRRVAAEAAVATGALLGAQEIGSRLPEQNIPTGLGFDIPLHTLEGALVGGAATIAAPGAARQTIRAGLRGTRAADAAVEAVVRRGGEATQGFGREFGVDVPQPIAAGRAAGRAGAGPEEFVTAAGDNFATPFRVVERADDGTIIRVQDSLEAADNRVRNVDQQLRQILRESTPDEVAAFRVEEARIREFRATQPPPQAAQPPTAQQPMAAGRAGPGGLQPRGPQIEFVENFPLGDAARNQLQGEVDETAQQILANSGIRRIQVDSPASFELSQQAGVNPGGVLRLNPTVQDVRNSVLHEAGHVLFQRASVVEQAQLRQLVSDNLAFLERGSPGFARQFREGKPEEAIAQLFADIDSLPSATQNELRSFTPSGRSFDEVFPQVQAQDAAPVHARPARTVRSFDEIKQNGGFITDQDDLREIVRLHGDRMIVIKDVNGGRSIVPASQVADIVDDPLASGFIREIFLPAQDIPLGPAEIVTPNTVNALLPLREAILNPQTQIGTPAQRLTPPQAAAPPPPAAQPPTAQQPVAAGRAARTEQQILDELDPVIAEIKALNAEQAKIGQEAIDVGGLDVRMRAKAIAAGVRINELTARTKVLYEELNEVIHGPAQVPTDVTILPAQPPTAGRALPPPPAAQPPTAGRAVTGATDEAFASRPPPPVPDGRAGGSGPPRQSNRPTADAGLPEDQRTAIFRPAPTVRAADDPLVQRVAQAVRDTKPATQESLQALARGRSRQIARAGAGARTAQTFGEVGPAATRRMGGEIARPEFESIAQLFTPEEHEALLSRIWGRGSVLEFANAQPGQINFRQLNAARAFEKLFHPDSATLPTPFELELLERVFGPELVRAVMSKKRFGQRAWDTFLDIWNLPRALLATGDISATIRQAGVLGPGNPIEFKNAFRDQIKAFASEPFALASREAIEADPDFLRFTTKSGTPGGVGQRADRRLHISAIGEAADRSRREEQFMTSIAGRLPIIRNSERAFVTMLNELRFSVMKKMVRHVELASGGAATDVQLDRIADFINYATGRGSLGLAEGAAPLLNGLGFSPRLAISRFQLPLPIFTRAPNVRKKFAQDLVLYAGTGAMIMFLLDQNVPGVDVIRDPRSSDFGKVKIGKTRLDLFAGNLQTARFVFALASGERQSAGTRSVAGVNKFDTVARFLRTKAHPSLGLVLDVASEEDFLGEEFTLSWEAFTETDLRRNPLLKTFTPLLIQDIIEAWKESGPLEAVIAGTGSLLGAGAITFATADDASQEIWDQPITEVWPFQQGMAKDLHARTSDRGPSAFDQSDINHYAAFQDILQQLRDGAIDERTAVNRYFFINTFYSGLREGLSAGIFGGDLTEEPVFPAAPSGGTPEQKAALQEYFDSQAPFETASGLDSKAWRRELAKLETKWESEGTSQYVLANTHTRPIPAELLELLPDRQRGDIQRSSDARAVHMAATDTEPAPVIKDRPRSPVHRPAILFR
jgi:hypothetical protein